MEPKITKIFLEHKQELITAQPDRSVLEQDKIISKTKIEIIMAES